MTKNTSRIVAVICIYFLATYGGAQAQFANSNWSFDDHPHPSFSDLTEEEHEQLATGIFGLERVEYCRSVMANAFDIYRARYPELRKTGELDKNYRDWKKSVAKQNPSGIGTCPFSLPLYELVEHRPAFVAAGLVFCGANPPPQTSDVEVHFEYLTGQLISNISTGHKEALFSLLLTHDMESIVSLNPDIEYFIRKSIERIREFEPTDWDVSALTPQLDAERIAFLDQAIEAGDFQSVVATTKPCSSN